MNHSRTIPVVNIAGPGSQPEEEDFNFLPIPAGINLPLTPVLPEQALPAELRVARHILTTLIRDMDNPVATLPFPLSYKLNTTEQQNSGLLDQLLGEGEISARVLLSDGKEQRIQETVFTASGVCMNITLISNGLPMKLSLARSQRASGRRIRSRRLRQNCRRNRRD